MLGVPSAWNYTAVDGVMLYGKPVGNHTTSYPKIPYASAKSNQINWGTFAGAKKDGLIAAIQVSRYANLSDHFKSTRAFFKDCKVWVGSFKKPVYVLIWICKKSSHKCPNRVATYWGKTVFEFFVSFSDIGLTHFD